MQPVTRFSRDPKFLVAQALWNMHCLLIGVKHYFFLAYVVICGIFIIYIYIYIFFLLQFGMMVTSKESFSAGLTQPDPSTALRWRQLPQASAVWRYLCTRPRAALKFGCWVHHRQMSPPWVNRQIRVLLKRRPDLQQPLLQLLTGDLLMKDTTVLTPHWISMYPDTWDNSKIVFQWFFHYRWTISLDFLWKPMKTHVLIAGSCSD